MYKISILMTLTTLAACSSETSTGPATQCQSNEECAAGQVCTDNTCETLCTTDLNCPPAEICEGSVCTPGARDLPLITDVNGDDTLECVDTPTNNCVIAGFVVARDNLLGAAFQLRPTAGGSIDLSVRGTPTDTLVTLDVPNTVQPGTYVLSASNGSGSADQTVELLQGPSGPSGPSGPPGALDQTQLDAMNAAIAAAVPTGTVVPFVGPSTAVPAGWRLCDGSEVSRTGATAAIHHRRSW